MIAHHDELWMTDPAVAHVLAAVHVKRERLEETARNLAANGWTDPEVIACRACASPSIPLAA